MKTYLRIYVALLFLSASPSFAQTVTGTGGALTPDGTTSGVVTFTAEVAGAPGSIISGGVAPDINVPAILGYNTEITNITLSDVQHTFAADLDLRLISPNGAVYTFNLDNGGSTGLDVATDMVFDVTAADCADDWTSSGSAAQPESGLLFETIENTCGPIEAVDFVFMCQFGSGEIVGDEVNGTWTLEVTDDAGGDTGSFTEFSLTFASITPPAEDSNGRSIDPVSCIVSQPVPVDSPLALLLLVISLGLLGGIAATRRRGQHLAS